MDIETRKKEAYRIGFAVLILLAVATAGEFFIGKVAYSWWFILILIALLKAYYIVRDYMHLPRLFRGEEEVSE